MFVALFIIMIIAYFVILPLFSRFIRQTFKNKITRAALYVTACAFIGSVLYVMNSFALHTGN